jgi:hypothetical protein
MFRRFEFRALLERVDELDEAVPAAGADRRGRARSRGAKGELPVERSGSRRCATSRSRRDRERGRVSPAA